MPGVDERVGSLSLVMQALRPMVVVRARVRGTKDDDSTGPAEPELDAPQADPPAASP
ncbi:MAG: hypothetical protein H6712_19800 [Myxococcales bacterium]|nr:hypothetical protein [Myxococcales bacterium]MCB9716120.1 hypothetical protein [Myxococcales bacterium]